MTDNDSIKRKLITTTFLTLDGVMQAPGTDKEDPSGNFSWGGWSVKYWDEMMGNFMQTIMENPYDLLLGRRTYDIFASHWPYVKNDPAADSLNRARKYVVSQNDLKLEWQNSVTVTGDVVGEINKLLEQDGPDLWVHGSGNLIQTLLAHHLVHTMHIWTFPVLVGTGKRLFADGTRAEGLKLVDCKVATTGVIIASYERAGDLQVGSFALENLPAEKRV
ncbi:dihydrofolate reductase family protein [Paenibacillus sp. HJGM_3]|uniref:dihydrofolate reductase family protein n=1 Tax=Paenibacillus sp. HJGM_3 TaxID=3379816 RepID=UPI00385D7A37